MTLDQEESEIPIQIIGLPANDVETRRAEVKFRRSLQAHGQIYPDIVEARAVVKTSHLEKERRRYEVSVMIRLSKEQMEFSDEGWSLEEVFDKIGIKMKRVITKPRDKPAHQRRHSRGEMERARFAE